MPSTTGLRLQDRPRGCHPYTHMCSAWRLMPKNCKPPEKVFGRSSRSEKPVGVDLWLPTMFVVHSIWQALTKRAGRSSASTWAALSPGFCLRQDASPMANSFSPTAPPIVPEPGSAESFASFGKWCSCLADGGHFDLPKVSFKTC